MARTAVVPETIEYPESDGLPMAENDFQLRTMTYAIEALDNHFRTRSDVYVSGDLFIYHEENNNRARIAPDVFVVFGVPDHLRRTYLLWQEGKAPDFVMEVSSPSTWRADQGSKRDTYAKIGVSEYWLYDPTGDYLTPRLHGFRLVDGRYAPIAVRDDGALTGRSEVLALELRLYPDDRFRFHDPASGQDLLSLEEAERGRDAEVQARQAAEDRLQRAQDRLQESEAAREALEARLRQLERRLHREEQGHDDPEDRC